ncbi:aldo/keto reductase [Saxibacter everestensis]|uniref:Aldo/keto reductase n=1 Tax=Saxibacter everestensis TaxID=2909229 RepID=A0ABY8QPX3_9MICO|nr:aldo/keto reductase [Brevibacteriaceae bacterium ZFBP1038]
MSATVPLVTLNNEVKIPQLGYGVFQVPPEGAQSAVEKALEAGYRHIDTAAAYRNEAGVGAALKASGIPRDEVFITTKLRNGDQGFDSTLEAFVRSREALGLDVIDLYLIHWPYPSKDLYVESWKALEKLYADGAVRAIGVSNFLTEHLDRLLAETDIVPAVNQIESHPTLEQAELGAYSRSKGIKVEAYSPLGQGADLSADVVGRLAEKYGKTTGQIVLRWHLQKDRIVIPKSVTPERIVSNIDVFDFELTADELAAITALESGNRIGADPATAAFTQF